MEYICKQCNRSAEEGDAFCSFCGGRIIAVQSSGGTGVCPGCGEPTAPDELFCSNCGKRLDGHGSGNRAGHGFGQTGTAPWETPVNPIPDPQPNIGKLLIRIIVIIVVLLVLGITLSVGIYIFRNTEPRTVQSPVNTAVSTSVPRDGGGVSSADSTEKKRENPTPVPTKAAQAPEEKSASGNGQSDAGYLFPFDRQYISQADLASKSQYEVRLMLNELYARHGYTFENADNIAYFNSKSWYRSQNKSMAECEKEFNSYEKENQKTIVLFEQSRGWR